MTLELDMSIGLSVRYIPYMYQRTQLDGFNGALLYLLDNINIRYTDILLVIRWVQIMLLL